MNKSTRALQYLEHIALAVQRIQRYCDGMSREQFLTNELVQDAVLRNLEVIGEAANNLMRKAPDYAQAHSHIPWQVLYTMRNRISHGYEKVDLDIVWTAVDVDLAPLLSDVQRLIESA